MKILVAMDSFKGSLSSIEAGEIIKKAIQEINLNTDVKVYPLADGGEGTLESLVSGLGGETVQAEATGALGNRIMSRYGYIKETKTAIIEMADVAGLTLVSVEKRNPLNTTTFGLGELILSAMDRGARNFIIGIGGSATNDAGIGMLSALGVKFLTKNGNRAGIFGKDLASISDIEMSDLDERIKDCSFNIACDVENPLYGEKGCSFVFAPQKGATKEIVEYMDEAIKNFSFLAKNKLNIVGAEAEGAGAAGGLGYAFSAFLGGKLEKGVKLVLEANKIELALKDADILITGEGRIDSQSIMGKAPIGVAKLAKIYNKEICVIALCGCASFDAEIVNEYGIDGYFPIINAPMSSEMAMDREITVKNLARCVKQIMRVYGHSRVC